MQDYGIPLISGIVPILTLLCLTMAVSVLTVKNARIRSILCGRPSVVIANGKLDQREMARNRLTVDELMEELRCQGYGDLSAVHYAVLETNGRLSILPYAAQQPPTAQDLQLSVEEPGLPLLLISDGHLLAQNLKLRGYDRNWLDKRLAEHGLHHDSEVFLMTVDQLGKVVVIQKEAPA